MEAQNKDSFSASFKESSVAEFFKQNRHMLGLYGKIRSLTTVIAEYVCNSLDACEEGGILPEIIVKIIPIGEEHYEIHVLDNGPGIPKEKVGKALGKLLAGTKFHRLIQSLTADELMIYRQNNKIQIEPIGIFVDKFLKPNEYEKDISKLNISVPCFDHIKYIYTFRKIKTVIRHSRKNEIYEIKTKYNKKIKVTGCHSVFSLNAAGLIKETEVRNLSKGDYIACPNKLPEVKIITKINCLDYLDDNTVGERWFCYGIDNKIISSLFKTAKLTKKRDKTGKLREYFKLKDKNKNELLVLKESVQYNYLKKHFLPINIILKMGLNNKVKNGTIRSYIHGNIVDIPAEWNLTPGFVRFLGLYVAEGHLDKRQIGFTFGKHEQKYITEISSFAKSKGIHTTLEKRIASLRIKVFGGIISNLMRNWCGHLAKNKKIPEFIFSADYRLRQQFLDALYQGDGHNTKSRNQLMHVTVSETLANQLQYLWLLQGVVTARNERMNKGLGKTPSKVYVTTTYGKDINKSNVFSTNTKCIIQEHKLLPIQIFNEFKHKKVNQFNPTMPEIFRILNLGDTKIQINKYIKIFDKLFKGKSIANINKHKFKQLLNLGFIDNNYNPTKIVELLKNKLQKIKTLTESNLSLLRIVDVKKITIGFKQVYDISVPGYENFVAGSGGIACHNTRGQQGIGASGCILLSQVTTGKPTKVISGSGGRPTYMELEIDIEKNEPKIKAQKELDYDYRGLAIKSEIKDVNYQNSNQNALEYLRRTAIVNPHVTINYTDPFNNTYIFERSTGYIPKKPIAIKPHIKCVTTDDLKTLVKAHPKKSIAGLFKQEFDRVGDKTIKDINSLLNFDITSLNMNKATWEQFEKVVKAIAKTKTISPRLDSLIPIEEKYLEESLRKIVKPEFLSVLTRKPTVYKGGYPLQVEVAIAYGGDSGQTLANNEKRMELMRFANKAPLLFDNGACAITKAVNSIDWKRYNIRDIETQPITILVNLASVHIPYTSAGKQAIAEEDEIVEEIRKALMTAVRSLGIHLSKKKGLELKLKKRSIFIHYAKELAEGLHLLTDRNKKELVEKLEVIITQKLQLEEDEDAEDPPEDEIIDESKQKGKKEKITDFFSSEGEDDDQ